MLPSSQANVHSPPWQDTWASGPVGRIDRIHHSVRCLVWMSTHEPAQQGQTHTGLLLLLSIHAGEDAVAVALRCTMTYPASLACVHDVSVTSEPAQILGAVPGVPGHTPRSWNRCITVGPFRARYQARHRRPLPVPSHRWEMAHWTACLPHTPRCCHRSSNTRSQASEDGDQPIRTKNQRVPITHRLRMAFRTCSHCTAPIRRHHRSGLAHRRAPAPRPCRWCLLDPCPALLHPRPLRRDRSRDRPDPDRAGRLVTSPSPSISIRSVDVVQNPLRHMLPAGHSVDTAHWTDTRLGWQPSTPD